MAMLNNKTLQCMNCSYNVYPEIPKFYTFSGPSFCVLQILQKKKKMK